MQKKIIIIAIIIFVGIGIYFAAENKNTLPIETQTRVGTSVGNTAPSFTITTINGKTIHSSDLLGKIVVMSSAAQWCPTCQEEAREFAPVYEKYKDKSIVFITIDIDPRDTAQSIDQFQKIYNTPWDYADAQGGAEVIRKYEMNRFEITYVLDKTGVVRFNGDVLTRPDVLDAVIKKWM